MNACLEAIDTAALNNPRPFVKWAGGKRQLLGKILARMPKNYRNYYEPFVGGGAVFFELCPSSGFINDINTSLINAYLQIRDNPQIVMNYLDVLDTNQNKSEDSKLITMTCEINTICVLRQVFMMLGQLLFLFI